MPTPFSLSVGLCSSTGPAHILAFISETSGTRELLSATTGRDYSIKYSHSLKNLFVAWVVRSGHLFEIQRRLGVWDAHWWHSLHIIDRWVELD